MGHKKNAITKVASATAEDAKRRINRKKIFEYSDGSCGIFSHDSAFYDLGEYVKDEYKSTCCCCCETVNTEMIKHDSVVTIAFTRGSLFLNCFKFGCCAASCNACCPYLCQLPMMIEWKLEGGFVAYSVIPEHEAERFELFFYEKYKEKVRQMR